MDIRFISLACLILCSCTGKSQNRFKYIAEQALPFCVEAKMDTGICFLVDMSIPSGKNRLVVWDFEKQKSIRSGLCTHGTCNAKGFEYSSEPQFSNVPESHCSSLGKYRIGKRAWSSWGINIHYKLHGLEASNDKAFPRIVVFHSWDIVPKHEIHPRRAPESWGCPAVSNEFMRYADSLLQSRERPVLLWIVK